MAAVPVRDQRFLVERHNQADAQHGAGNDKGEHDEHIHHLPGNAFLADDNVADQHSDDDDEHDGNGGKQERVLDVGAQAVEDGNVAVQAEAADKAGEVCLMKLDTITTIWGRMPMKVTRATGKVMRNLFTPVELDLLRRAHGRHHVVFLAHQVLLNQQDGGGAEHPRSRTERWLSRRFRRSHSCIRCTPAREGPCSLPQKHGSSEIRQAGHKHHDGSGGDGGDDHRDGDGEQPAQFAASQIFRCSSRLESMLPMAPEV